MSTPRRKKQSRASELPTEFAMASDGGIYVNAARITPGARIGRQRFVGYRLTESEQRRYLEELHLVSLNVTVAALGKKKRKR